jgi:hypothetical protein
MPSDHDRELWLAGWAGFGAGMVIGLILGILMMGGILNAAGLFARQ